MEEGSVLVVKMLGGFSVSHNGVYVVSEHSRESKVVFFLQYLLAHRDRPLPQEELIDVLLGEEDGRNPVNTLKNIAYRARKLFLDAGLPAKEYIYNRRGAYGFSAHVQCDVDAERFGALLGNAKRAVNDDERLQYLQQAFACYDGDFLPRSFSQTWVVPRAVKYQDMFCECVSELCAQLLARGEFATMLRVTEKAVTLYPYIEDFHIQRVRCLHKLGRIKEVVTEYESACAILFDELGVTPSEEFRDVYRTATAGLENMAASVEQVLTGIMEGDDADGGAYYCNYHIFSNTCRFVSRHVERLGQSAFLVLCTLADDQDRQLTPERIKGIAPAFHKSMGETMRRSDIYTRYSPSQFLILLTGLNSENCNMVLHRLAVAFKKHNRDVMVKLHCGKASVVLPPEAKENLVW